MSYPTIHHECVQLLCADEENYSTLKSTTEQQNKQVSGHGGGLRPQAADPEENAHIWGQPSELVSHIRGFSKAEGQTLELEEKTDSEPQAVCPVVLK